MPGVKKEDISLEVNDGVLTISADINQEKKETKEGYVCNERRCGHVERSFNLEVSTWVPSRPIIAMAC